MTQIDDRELLDQTRAGKTDAFRELLERHGGAVWSHIDSDIGQQWRGSIDADDVMQVTYMEAFLQMRNLAATDAAGFIAWLRRIAKNNLQDAIKELSRKKRPPPGRRIRRGAGDESYVTLVEVLGGDTGTPSRAVAQDEAAAVLRDMLDRLPPDYAKVVQLYDLDGRDISDVCEELGRSAGAIHMLRARAHARLRSMLGEETNFFTKVV